MIKKDWIQIPVFRCAGNIDILKDAIKEINKTNKYEIVEDSSNITIKLKEQKIINKGVSK